MASGFPAEGLAFLKALKKHNDRDWFQARKDVFETKVKAPMIELIEGVNKALHDFAPDYENDPKKALYRIYRDTRFSNDKTPYKTHIAAIFPRRGLGKHVSAGFYFQISPEGVGLAAGAYMPGPEELYAIRSWLTDHHKDFAKASQNAEKVIGPLQGSSLVRSPKGFDPEHPAAELVRRKQWFYWKELGTDLATSPKLLAETIRHFRAARPVIDLLNSSLSSKPKNLDSIL